MLLPLTGVPDAFAQVVSWAISNYIEVLATVTGLIYLIYSVRGKILLWLFGIISSLCFVYVFFQSKIYANMGLYVYYVIISIYGWMHWSKTTSNKKELPFSKIKSKLAITLFAISTILFIILSFVLREFTDSDVVFLDSFTTAISIVATWMLARKILEHWIIWILVDVVYVILYLNKGLYATVVLFTIYSTLAILGYIEWHKKWKRQTTK